MENLVISHFFFKEAHGISTEVKETYDSLTKKIAAAEEEIKSVEKRLDVLHKRVSVEMERLVKMNLMPFVENCHKLVPWETRLR